ncbi:EAL domain-containing protein [Motilimonas pumila]|uniref:EAL domain-containing protein n=1 Tax=Motilimonas pumila TaxID=2303987 RepID=A0A418YHT1_9GAMM|nr:EAL domain-containing protein [Motilimonas pumila]RJG49938.1 EAL domain-containing protein [Motilimonas pumila]
MNSHFASNTKIDIYKRRLLPVIVAILPSLMMIYLELVDERQQVDSLLERFEVYSHSVAEGTQAIERELYQISNDFDSCNEAFMAKMKQMEYRRSAINDFYLVTPDKRNACLQDPLPGALKQLDFTPNQTPQVTMTEHAMVYQRYVPGKNVSIVWVVSHRYIWVMSRWYSHQKYWLVHNADGKQRLYSNNDTFTTDKSEVDVAGFRHLEYQLPGDYGSSIELYYKPATAGNLSRLAWLRIFLTALISMVFACVLAFRLRRDLYHQMLVGFNNNEFESFFQPIVELETGRWCGAEALMRWHRNGKPYAFPDEFIPLAESKEVAANFHYISFDSVLRLINMAPTLPHDFFFSINVCPNEIDITQLDDFKSQCDDEMLARVEMEITERGIVEEHLSERAEMFKLVNDLGVKVSLDDFGTGQSGLTYIGSLPFDKIKIDRRFVQAIGTDSINFHILTTIIELAHKLKVVMVAEGVETPEQRDWLKAQGVTLAQGWLFAKALEPQKFIEQLPANITLKGKDDK